MNKKIWIGSGFWIPTLLLIILTSSGLLIHNSFYILAGICLVGMIPWYFRAKEDK